MSGLQPPFSIQKASLSDAEAASAYETILQQVPDASPFLSIPAAQAAIDAYNLGGSIWLVFDKDEAPVAGLIAYEKKRGPFTALAFPPLIPLSGPILAAPLRETDIHTHRTPLDALLKALPYDQETLALGPRWTDVRMFQWAGWRIAPRYTYWIELDSDPLASWSRTPRKILRNESEHYAVREEEKATAYAVRLMRESYERKGKRLKIPPEHIQLHADLTLRAGLARCYVAINKNTGDPEAAAVIALNESIAHSWFGGSVPGPSRTVCYGRVLPEMVRSGITSFDFTGANVASVAEFKRQFGGTLVQGFRARRVSNPLLRLVEGFREQA